MPTTLTRQQKRWHEIVNTPALRDLPYKVETDTRGKIILSPHKARHSRQQRAVQKLFDRYLSGGETYPEYPIATTAGVKQADVVWVSPDREEEMNRTGDPPTIAPEICVEVMSSTNTEDEMLAKAELYVEAGAEEVWVVSEDGRIRFFDTDGTELNASAFAAGCPDRLPNR
jgi:Uma2 family endonuclease